MTKRVRKVKRHYLDKQPEIGDRIEIVDPTWLTGLPLGSELVVTDTRSHSGNIVYAVGRRFPGHKAVSDNEYLIYVDEVLEKVGEDIVQRKFLGIPCGKHYVEQWKVVAND